MIDPLNPVEQRRAVPHEGARQNVTRHTQEEQSRTQAPQSSWEPWGSDIGYKPPQHLRIGFHNIQGLPVNCHGPKHRHLRQDIADFNLDILGMAELNVNLHHMRPFQHWKERFRCFSRHHANWGTNRHALLKTPRLFGGTAIITMAPISRMVHESGEDASGLGRWVWTSYKGKNNSILRIVSIYRPVRDTNANPGTVYSQQEAYLLQHNDDRCPRKALLDDLRLILEEWITQGNNIIVGMDANENVRIGDTHRLMTC